MAWWMYDKPTTPKVAQAEFVAKNSGSTESTDTAAETAGSAVRTQTPKQTGFFTNLKNTVS